MNHTRTFTKGVLLGLAGLVALLVLDAGLSYWNVQQLYDDARWVAHTHEVMDILEEALGHLREAEVVQRTYLITGGADLPPSFAENIDAAKRKIERVKTLTEDNADQQARIPELERRVVELTALWSRTVSARKEQNFEAARQTLLRGESRQKMADLQELFRQMDETERALLRQRQTTNERTFTEAIVTGFIAAAIGLLAVGLLVGLLGRHLRTRQQAEKMVRESERRFRTLVEQVKDYAIFMTDREGRPTSWNEGVQRVLGFEEAEWIGKDIASLIFIPKDVQEGVPQKELRQATVEGTASDDRWMTKKDGARFFALGVTTALRDEAGVLLGFTKVLRDQTERKQLEDKLRQIAAELSEANRRKDEFLAMLAHELRNPLAPIRNGLQLIRLAGGQTATVEEARAMMERQFQQLVRLVDDLMDVSRITRGKVELHKERLQLAAVLNSAIETSRPLIEQMGHQLTVRLPEQPIVIEADLNRLAQVFLNLLNNAAKYSDRGGRIELTAERQGSDAVVSIRDTGIGIAADQLPRIFEMFSQAERSLERSQGGLGLGLTLVRRLVEMHGGTVEARSEGPGKGAEFFVRVPVAGGGSQPPAAPGKEEQTSPKSSLRILIVDDNRDSTDSLATMLRMTGHVTHTAYDGEQAIAAVEEFRPDVILLDIGLPKLNGYEVCRRIRETPKGKGLTIIAQTGWGQDEDRQRTRDAGFDYHMVKPVDPDALQKILARLHVRRINQ